MSLQSLLGVELPIIQAPMAGVQGSALARFYGVETRILVRAVKRNLDRFPGDFMFQLTNQEVAGLRSQPGITSRSGHGGRRTLPYAFTEHGAVMVASVLNPHRLSRCRFTSSGLSCDSDRCSSSIRI